MPEDMPDRMPDRMPENMSDRMPEDLPVTKCINVMVGITRSKVIFYIANILSKTLGASELLILPLAPASLKPCCCLLALAICGTEGLCEAFLRAQKLKVNRGLHKWGHPKMVGFSLTLLLKVII